MTIKKLGERPDLNIPIWIKVPNNSPTDYTFSDQELGEQDPMGEYIYYLAGDYALDEKKCLLLSKFKTYAQVVVNFESDIINVAGAEVRAVGARPQIDDWIREGTLDELSKYLPNNTQTSGGVETYRGTPIILTFVTWNGDLTAFVKSFIFHDCSQGNRLTEIIIATRNPDMIIGKTLEAAKSLLDEYNNISDHHLSGAVRV